MYVDRDPRLYVNVLVPGEIRGLDAGLGMPGPFTYPEGYPLENDFYSYYDDTNTLVSDAGGYTLSSSTYTAGREHSGYLINKFICETCSGHGDIYSQTASTGYAGNRFIAPYIRVAQLYLDYAEAAYEATGQYDVPPTGCTMTAEAALNVIRNRATIGDWAGGEDFREAYRRERCVELMFENHRWFDIRRWMIAESIFAAGMQGVSAERLTYDPTVQGTTYTASSKTESGVTRYFTAGSSIETSVPSDSKYDCYRDLCSELTIGNVVGFKNRGTEAGEFRCTPFVMTTETRSFGKKNYWYPFSITDVEALSNLTQNPGW